MDIMGRVTVGLDGRGCLGCLGVASAGAVRVQAAVSRRNHTNRCLTAGRVSDSAVSSLLEGRCCLGMRLVGCRLLSYLSGGVSQRGRLNGPVRDGQAARVSENVRATVKRCCKSGAAERFQAHRLTRCSDVAVFPNQMADDPSEVDQRAGWEDGSLRQCCFRQRFMTVDSCCDERLR